MPADVTNTAPLPSFTPIERRILGVLVEKAKTTPEGYPLSLNAIVVGSNQKSNRDPVMNLSDEDVEPALTTLQQKGLVTRITGSRVDRWRHNLYEQWMVGKVELAILAELLLRGPQTEGELRGRASRMEEIADLETLRNQLRPMRERGLVVFLGEEGRRGTLITHGFHDAAELTKLREGAPTEQAESFRSPPPTLIEDHPLQAEVTQLKQELTALRTLVAELQASLTNLVSKIGS